MSSQAMTYVGTAPVPGIARWILMTLANGAHEERWVFTIGHLGSSDLERLARQTGLLLAEVEAWTTWLRMKGYLREVLREDEWALSAQPYPCDLPVEPAVRPRTPEADRREPSAALRALIYERDEYRCARCGSETDLQIDHIHPYIHGGKTVEANLQTLCRPCNIRKGARVPE